MNEELELLKKMPLYAPAMEPSQCPEWVDQSTPEEGENA